MGSFEVREGLFKEDYILIFSAIVYTDSFGTEISDTMLTYCSVHCSPCLQNTLYMLLPEFYYQGD